MPAWAYAAIIGAVQLLVVGLIVALRAADQDRIAKLEQWIRDKEKYDHEFRHDEYAVAITTLNSKIWPMENQIKQLEKNQDGLRLWKHEVVDPYIPRAVDEHERRLERLDRKVFNGGTKHEY